MKIAKNFYGSEMAAYFFAKINTGIGVNTSKPVSKNHEGVLNCPEQGLVFKNAVLQLL